MSVLAFGQKLEPRTVRFMTLDPGHFHAALVHKEMYPEVSPQVIVYAPLGPDLMAHMNRIAGFNLRQQHPTGWELMVHAAPDFLEAMLRDRPGNVAVLSGRNAVKINRVKRAVEAGLNVLVDKPWVLRSADLPKLEAALDTARRRRLIAYDMMTERYEVTSMLLRELTRDADLFGAILPGTEAEPAVYMESVHHLLKTVAGIPGRRPAWFFDIRQQGEGLSDVGTHLVDLAQWTLFPDQSLDYRKDLRIGRCQRWPVILSRDAFERVTGEKDFPDTLAPYVRDGALPYYCNNRVAYSIRGVHVMLDVLWRYEAPPDAGDLHCARFRGSKCTLEIRQGAEERYRPELYVISADPRRQDRVLAALKRRIAALQQGFPGLALQDLGARLLVKIPDRRRVGHEAHFAQVVAQFLAYLRDPDLQEDWERSNMLAKYYVTTRGVELATTVTGPPDCRWCNSEPSRLRRSER